MNAIINKTLKSYIGLGLLLYAILFIYWENSISWYNALNFFTFVSYAFLLRISTNKQEEYYNDKRLGITVFAFSLVYLCLYLMMSDYYMGNTFLFSEVDARIYEHDSFHMLDLPFCKWGSYMNSRGLGFDDWGTAMTQAMILHIIPSKLFLNIVYVLLNTVSSVLLFRIGNQIMMKSYAYLASLSYATASYSIFFMGTFTKEEIMVCILIVSMYLLYRYWESKNALFLLLGGITSSLLLFFRVPVALFVWASYGGLLVLGSSNKAKLSLIILVGFVVAVLIFGIIIENFNRYTNAGNIGESYTYQNNSQVQKIVLYISAAIGPFPQFLQGDKGLSFKGLYGSGLLMKLLLVYPFWLGVVHSVKTKCTRLYPLIFYSLLEMVSLGLVLDSLEFRKGLPHVPFVILIAFWYMSQFDENADDEIRQTPYYKKVNTGMNIWIVAVFFIGIAWNIFRI